MAGLWDNTDPEDHREAMAKHSDPTALSHPAVDPDDPGLQSWVLALLFWAECMVAVIAALRAPGGVAQPILFGVYAVLLAVAAVARSGPLGWMRWMTWVALGAVVVVHLVARAWSLGERSAGMLELAVYTALVVVCAVLTHRERPMPRDPALRGWARGFEITARAAGLGFLAGVLLMLLDRAVRLPFSGH